jgi:glycosyltransferase involved in cell wall biosynthesis
VTAITVVIPTYQRRDRLGRVLDALARQTHTDFEVVVIDDGSTDGTAQYLQKVRFPFQVHAISQQNAGPAAARNAGVAAARGELVLFLDDDVLPSPGLVGEHLRAQAAERRCAVMGPLGSLPRYAQPWVAWEQAMLEDQYAAMSRGEWEPTFRQFWTGNASVAREEILAAGGFDPAFRRAEDVELAARLARRGVRFRFQAAARAEHAAERTLDSWCAMHLAYGRLERRIFAHMGEGHALSTLTENWARLHPATRALVRACLRSAAVRSAAIAGLRGILQASRVAPASRVARRACSALANILYWSGAREAMGAAEFREMVGRAATA